MGRGRIGLNMSVSDETATLSMFCFPAVPHGLYFEDADITVSILVVYGIKIFTALSYEV